MRDFRRDTYGTPLVADPVKVNQDGTPATAKYSRPSSFTKAIEDTYNLAKWEQRQHVRGIALALRDPFEGQKVGRLLDQLSQPTPTASADRDCDAVIAVAKTMAQTSLAAQRGTWVHTMTEHIDRGTKPSAEFVAEGEALGITRDVMRVLGNAWRALIAEHHITVDEVELPVVNDEFRSAGTLDRIIRLNSPLVFRTADGELITLGARQRFVLDLKTGEMKTALNWWNSYAAQIYLYASAVPYDTETDTRLQHNNPPDPQWGFLAHLDVKAAMRGDTDIATLLLVDLVAGRHACTLAAAAKEWARRDAVFHRLHTTAVPADAPPTAVEQPPAGDAPSPSRPGGHLTPQQQKAAVPEPNEGGDTRTAKDWIDLELRHKHLGDSGKQFVKQVLQESMQAGVSWHQRERRTDRRWHLHDAVIALAEQNMPEQDALETLRALVAYIVGGDWPLFPVITVGHAVGALNADEAARLAQAVRDFDRGVFHADDNRDVVELRRVA